MKIISVIMLVVTFFSCSRSRDKREYEIMADMAHSYALEAQEESPVDTGHTSMRKPPMGTIARGQQPYPYTTEQGVLAGDELLNPLPMTQEVLEVGKRYFLINCVPCHGKHGAGDGNVIKKATFNQRMPAPPVLYSKKLMDFKDGHIFNIISKGQGNMPSYGYRIDVNTRWAIVNYLRVIQRAARVKKLGH